MMTLWLENMKYEIQREKISQPSKELTPFFSSCGGLEHNFQATP